jgi:hypothetical protein
MLVRVALLVLVALPVGIVIWLVLARGFGVGRGLVIAVDIAFIAVLYALLRLGHPWR